VRRLPSEERKEKLRLKPLNEKAREEGTCEKSKLSWMKMSACRSAPRDDGNVIIQSKFTCRYADGGSDGRWALSVIPSQQRSIQVDSSEHLTYSSIRNLLLPDKLQERGGFCGVLRNIPM
jgi:hypothetical protein